VVAEKIKRKYEAETLGEFLRKIAIDYLRYGYTRYSLRTIPSNKNLYEVDAKIMRVYGCTFSRAVRHHRRRKGLANVVYIRFKNRFILVASVGSNEAFDKIDFLDFHTTPLNIDGYTIGVKRNKPCVMVKPSRFRILRKQLLAIALHNENKVLTRFRAISPFSFPEIIRQKRKLLSEINKRRHTAGLARIVIDLRFSKN
jgi:hypothetical protein